jgi:hypothetical protein
VSAVNRSGSARAASTSPATEKVSGTSAVGMSQRPSVVRNMVSPNFGSLSVP